MKIHIKRFFDKAADCYDSSADIQKIIAIDLLKRIQEQETDLAVEIGTGSGLFTEIFLEKLCPKRFIGLDISYSMAKACRTNSGLFIQADGESLPLAYNSADIIVSSSVFQWFQHPQTSIPNALRILKKGGRFAFSIFCDGTFAEMSTLNSITGFGSVYPLKDAEFYQELFSNIPSISFHAEIHDYVLNFGSVKEFLQKQKSTGASYTGKTTNTGKKAYHRFCELYESFFGDGKTIPVTYRIAYITGEKI